MEVNLKAWIIYNGALKYDKISNLVTKLANEATKKGITIQLIKNNEIIIALDSMGEPFVKSEKALINPDFVVFWDKDIHLARHLEMMGYKLFNNSWAIEACDNKALMHQMLSRSAIRAPKTIIAPFTYYEQELSENYLKMVFETLGKTVVIKECFGSFGMQVFKVDSVEDLIEKSKQIGNRPFIMQEYIKTSIGKDIRVNIVGDEIVGAMERSNPNDFRANITLGGTGKVIELTNAQKELALKAHKALKLDFSGVDLLYGENGETIICEINSNVNYLSFEEVSGVNFGEKLLEHILDMLSESSRDRMHRRAVSGAYDD